MIESPWVLFAAACPLSCYVCWTVHKASSVFDWAGLWDWAAPIGALAGLGLLTPMTIAHINAAASVPSHTPASILRRTATMWLVIIGLNLNVTIAVEANGLMEVPDRVDDLEERAPGGMWRALTGEDVAAGEPGE